MLPTIGDAGRTNAPVYGDPTILQASG